MDVGGTVSKVLGNAVIIGTGWAVVSGVIGVGIGAMIKPTAANPSTALVTFGAVAAIGFVMLGVGLLVTAFSGFLAAKANAGGGTTDMGSAAAAGIISGAIFGIAYAIVSAIISAISVVSGLVASPLGASAGLVAVLIGTVIGALFGIPITAVISLGGAVVYAATKK